MAEQKCTFGLRPPIDLVTLNAQIEREVKNFRIYKHYRPQFEANPVTSKFYARHEAKQQLDEATQNKTNQYFRGVELARAKGPKDKFPRPVLESHKIGWYMEPPFNRTVHLDPRFFHPLVESEPTKQSIMIAQEAAKKLKRE